MSTKSKGKQAKWSAILEDFNQSGSSITAYCNDHLISVATFSYWKKKLLQVSQNEPEFVKVPASNAFLLPFHGPSPITIHMRSIEICISDNCHPELLESLFEVLNKYA